ncbi:PfkB family carbohydrate kinase [Phreatobacter sp. AB_2022a]|uniref:PfkB family carbohydrate kinase n=1 Tax=Phreatobacter sp. AB_2022a TaxID=3003134 RepID=UPI00228750B3|nr:PfkB family carbohydrate kinase [Phreatobacter sp. AB_2022a]MCZ0733607.1 PfkB family carbohydrate kinase [Phreatobacter sp. AB_2022a]
MTSVLCVGVAVYDEIFALPAFPTRPTKIFASDFASAAGGPAANAAITIARQGGAATLWARIGNDMQGDRIVADLSRSDVDVSRIRRVDHARSGISAVGVTQDGERMLLVFADPNLDTDASWLPLDDVDGFDAILADVRWPAASRAVIERATRLGKPTVLDADLTSDPTALAGLVPLASHVVFSEPALAQMAGAGRTTEAALRSIYDQGGHLLVGVTLGEDGACWVDAAGFHREPGIRIDAVDTLAAGDVFHGAFALAVARGLAPREAMRFANLVAAVKCTRWGGGATIPTAAEVAAFVARQASTVTEDFA